MTPLPPPPLLLIHSSDTDLYIIHPSCLILLYKAIVHDDLLDTFFVDTPEPVNATHPTLITTAEEYMDLI